MRSASVSKILVTAAVVSGPKRAAAVAAERGRRRSVAMQRPPLVAEDVAAADLADEQLRAHGAREHLPAPRRQRAIVDPRQVEGGLDALEDALADRGHGRSEHAPVIVPGRQAHRLMEPLALRAHGGRSGGPRTPDPG